MGRGVGRDEGAQGEEVVGYGFELWGEELVEVSCVGGVRCWQIQGFRGGDEDENGLTVVGKNIFIGLHSFALFMV